MKKALKITTITLSVIAAIILILVLIGVSYFFISTKDVVLDIEKLDGNYSNIQVYDNNNEKIMQKNNSYTKYSEVSPYIIDTFVSVEDKRFFNHRGIDTRRMLSAALKNISSKSLKEGASTISQQLIKNTHLTNDKTFKRKLAEIRLALKLENKLTKEQIMEKYLNNLYFGSGIYGINDACKAFFDKAPNEVNLAEATILVGVVKNPLKNSPLTNIEGAKARQKVIFNVLENNKTFDENLINEAKNTQIVIKNGLIYNKINKSFLNNAIYESTCILNMDEKEVANSGFKIVTYLDKNLQKSMFDEMESYDLKYDYVRASIDNETMGVTSYVTNLSQIDSNISRQAGSLIKPFSVYMPCYENKMINSLSQILDEPININGYSPTNYNNVYHGYVSVKDSVAHSYNIPAVKLLKQLGMEQSTEFLSRYNIEVSDKFKNLSLALGANSVTPLQIASCYSSIANNGYFKSAKFVKQIIDKNGKVIYSNNSDKVKVVSEDVNYLMLDNLRDVVKCGTGRKLSNLPYQIACKTGTVANSDGNNTDAWCCAMTSENTFLAWDGAKSGHYLEKNHGGSSYPTLSIRDYANYVYNDKKPKDFEMPDSVAKLAINLELLQNEHIVQSVPKSFDGQVVYGMFAKDNLPPMTTFEVDFNVKSTLFDDIIEFNGENGKKYNIYSDQNGKKVLIKTVVCNGDIVRIICHKPNLFKHYKYYIEFCS